MGASLPISFLCLLFCFRFQTVFGQVGCKDESGNKVDWFLVYKIPKLEEKSHPFNTGFAYAVVTSKGGSLSWKLSNKLINQPDSIFGLNLIEYYKEKPSSGLSYVLYNDQIGGKASSTYAHAKGLLVMKGQSGFWLTHSIPQFPPPFEEAYGYPNSGAANGQTAFCVTFSTTELDKLVDHLLVIKPNIYSSLYSDDMLKKVPNLKNLQLRKWSKELGRQGKFSSLDSMGFTVFSKSSRSKVDLYDEYIAQSMRTDILAETWRRGKGDPLSSNCTGDYKVNNIEEVNLKFGGGGQTVPWKYREDHSKWGVSSDNKRIAVCFADINRMRSQFSRGGGALCTNDPKLWALMRGSIAGVEACPRG